MPDHPARPRARADVVFRELGDGWVLFDPVGRRLHTLNLTAALVWELCSGERGLDEIAEAVRDAFPDPPGPEQVRHDVGAALDRFVSEGLVR